MRCFIGIPLPFEPLQAKIRTHVTSVLQSNLADSHFDAASTKAWRWVPPENIHLTLNFLGELTDEKVGIIRTCLDKHFTIKTPQNRQGITLELTGAGLFPAHGRQTYYVLYIHPNHHLLALQQNLCNLLKNVGIEPDSRAYKPHITLARIKGDGRVWRRFDKELALPLSNRTLINHFQLLQSQSGEHRQHYTPLSSYPILVEPSIA